MSKKGRAPFSLNPVSGLEHHSASFVVFSINISFYKITDISSPGIMAASEITMVTAFKAEDFTCHLRTEKGTIYVKNDLRFT